MYVRLNTMDARWGPRRYDPSARTAMLPILSNASNGRPSMMYDVATRRELHDPVVLRIGDEHILLRVHRDSANGLEAAALSGTATDSGLPSSPGLPGEPPIWPIHCPVGEKW